MEKDRSKSTLPSTSDGIKTQEAAERLAEEDETLKKEVELCLQEELDKLLAENETPKGAQQPPRKTSQDFKASEKPRGHPKKTKVGVEQPTRLERTGVEEDLLTLLEEPWDLPKEPTAGKLENQWDNLSMLDESMLELKSKEKQEGPSRPEEEEEPSLWSMRSNIGTLFEHKIQHLQNLKDAVQRKSITTLPLGYFSKLSKRFSRSTAAEKEEQTSEDAEAHDQPRDWMPRFLKKSKPKRIVGFRTKSLKKSQLERDQVTELCKIFSEEFVRSQDRRGSEDILDEDISPSPEDFPQQNEEELKQTQEEAKKQEVESISSPPDVPSSSWHMGQGISHRQMGYSQEFPESVFKEKGYKQKFAKHERDSKVAVPLPLQELMEEEVLAILKVTLLDYQKKLGAHHPLTGEMEQAVDKLHLLLQGRGII